jgi:ligand-binding sensor domain-containing protein
VGRHIYAIGGSSSHIPFSKVAAVEIHDAKTEARHMKTIDTTAENGRIPWQILQLKSRLPSTNPCAVETLKRTLKMVTESVMRKTLTILLVVITVLITTKAFAQNRVLSVDGDGDYVHISDAPELQGGQSVVKAIEAWFIPKEMPFPVVGKRLDFTNKDWSIGVKSGGGIQFSSEVAGGGYQPSSPSGLILVNQWYHVAVVINRPESLLRLYLNGVLVVEDTDMGNESAATEAPVEIGAVTYRPRFGKGCIDEVRIWSVARTQEQIQDTMFGRLRGCEPGLIAYWQFEGEGKKVLDSTENGHHGVMVGDAKRVAMELPSSIQRVPKPVLISGVVTDEKGKPVSGASVRLEQNDLEIASATTDADGRYYMSIYPLPGRFDLSAAHGEYRGRRLGISMREVERRTLNLTLREAISIEGTILMLDDITPHVAVPVEAIRNGKKVAGTLTDERGRYRFVDLKPGRYQVRCQVMGGYVYYGEEKARKPESQKAGRSGDVAISDESIILRVQPDKPLRDIDLHIASFKKGIFRTYNCMDGLPSAVVNDIYCDKDGVMWLATRSGVSRYDGQRFVNFATEDGLVNNNVYAIYGDPDGTIWIGTKGGVSRYDGRDQALKKLEQRGVGDSPHMGDFPHFTNFTTKDGLAHNYVTAIHRDSRGYLWFGTGWPELHGAGVSRYDGRKFTNLTTEDGLVHNTVLSIDEAPDGILWFGTMHGISPYDGTRFDTPIYPGDWMGPNLILATCVASDGTIWFGTLDGLRRYDGKQFRRFTTEDGLPHNVVFDITEDSAGVLWIATGHWGQSGGGVSRFDGKTFVNFTIEDGLGSNAVFAVEHAIDGTLWFGFDQGGVSRYDSSGILNFGTKDGLINNWVSTVYIDTDSTIWFGLKGGMLSRYDGYRFHSYNVGSGSMTNMLTDICPAPDGKLWIVTWDSGVFCSENNNRTTRSAEYTVCIS